MTLMCFKKAWLVRYVHRPCNLQHLCLAEFAPTFVANYKPEDEGDVLPPPESDTMSSRITLTGGFGMMSRRKREAVIRFHRFNKDAEPTNWYCEELMLYFPWYDEDRDLLGQYATYV